MSNGGMHQQQSQAVFPRLTSRNRNFLQARWPTTTSGGVCPFMDFGTEAQTKLLVPDNKAAANKTFLTIMTLLNAASAEEAIVLQTYYASAIVSLFPDLEDVFVEAFAMNGVGVVKIKLPSQASANNINMSTEVSGAKTLIMLGQLLIMPFKNLTAVNYQNYIDRMIMAMKSFIVVTSSENQLRAIADVEKLIAIRSVFGQNVNVRQNLMQKIILGGKERYPFGNFYTYLSEILAWTDMAPFSFIADTLLEQRSPVLRDHRVQNEVMAFSEALYVITRYKYPQYYGILGPARGAVLLKRSRYPILLAVAEKVKGKSYTALNQFETTFAHDNSLVVELYNMHMRHVRGRLADENNTALRFLHTFSTEGGDVQAFATKQS